MALLQPAGGLRRTRSFPGLNRLIGIPRAPFRGEIRRQAGVVIIVSSSRSGASAASSA
jgi:hypothetical protein